MEKKDRNLYSDFSNVTNIDNELIPEEFPEGPFGSAIHDADPVSNKSTAWKVGQHQQSAFTYADKEHSERTERNYPDAQTSLDKNDKQ